GGSRGRNPGDQGLPGQRGQGSGPGREDLIQTEELMAPTAEKTPIRTTLIDITRCIGCRACQVACKQWNDRDGEETKLEDALGFQNPAVLSAKTYTLISFHEVVDEHAPGGVQYSFVMRRCLHCLEPACVSACPTTALERQPDGPVGYDS